MGPVPVGGLPIDGGKAASHAWRPGCLAGRHDAATTCRRLIRSICASTYVRVGHRHVRYGNVPIDASSLFSYHRCCLFMDSFRDPKSVRTCSCKFSATDVVSMDLSRSS